MFQPVEIIVVDSAARLAEKGADLFCSAAREAAADRGRFAAAISGGSTPRPMHRLLAQEPYLSAIPWPQLHLFWIDERMVATDDPASNYGTARRDLLDRSPIPPANIHPMAVFENPQSAASAYRQQLQVFFGPPTGGFPVFDQIFLGIGTDGHTASIFPQDSNAVQTRCWVAAVKGGNPNVRRLTLTLPVLNRARCIVFLVSGADKAAVVNKVLTDEACTLPAARIQPADGRLVWLMDRPAAALLPQRIR